MQQNWFLNVVAVKKQEGFLGEAEKFGLASQESRDADGSKCLVSIAATFAKHGYKEAAIETADKITQAARREHVLRRITEFPIFVNRTAISSTATNWSWLTPKSPKWY